MGDLYLNWIDIANFFEVRMHVQQHGSSANVTLARICTILLNRKLDARCSLRLTPMTILGRKIQNVFHYVRFGQALPRAAPFAIGLVAHFEL